MFVRLSIRPGRARLHLADQTWTLAVALSSLARRECGRTIPKGSCRFDCFRQNCLSKRLYASRLTAITPFVCRDDCSRTDPPHGISTFRYGRWRSRRAGAAPERSRRGPACERQVRTRRQTRGLAAGRRVASAASGGRGTRAGAHRELPVSLRVHGPDGLPHPRPTNGIFVAITVMKSTFASSGSSAM